MDDAERSDDKVGAGPLFSRSASDNVEVVGGTTVRGDVGLWSVSAKDPLDGTERPVSRSDHADDTSDLWDEGDGDGLWDLIEDDDDPRLTTFPPPPFGQPYRSPLATTEDAERTTHEPVSDRWPEWQAGHQDPEPVFAEVHPSEPAHEYTAQEYTAEHHEVVDDTVYGSDDTTYATDETVYATDETDGDVFDGSMIDDTIFVEDATAYADDMTANDDEASHAGPRADTHEDTGSYSDTGHHDTYHSTGPAEGLYDTVGSLFRSEPVERDEDVIDSPDDLDADPYEDLKGTSPFSSGRPSDGPEPFGDPLVSEPASGSNGPAFVAGSARSAFEPAAGGFEPAAGGFDPVGEAGTPGFLEAIDSLDAEDRARARTVLVVVGALLGDQEQVLGLVVGQMLGHPAVLALTVDRVLVVNDRPWQPVVDEYALDEELEIRGRHDRNMAAIGLGDGHQLSMVDGVRDVITAVSLVERIRSLTGAG